MAKPNQQGRYDQKKAEPAQVQEQEQEEEVLKDANESEHKQSQDQNTLGNAALQNQMIGGGQPDANAEGGGGGGQSMRKAGADTQKDHGGDDDAADDLPLTLEDLVRSWNPSIPKSTDRPSWLEPMPSDELPPEDLDYLEQVKSTGPIRVQGDFTIDSQLQPSRWVVAASLMDWGRAVQHWTGTTVLERTMAKVFVPGSSFLHDPWGRVLLNRARTGAIGSLLVQRDESLLDSPTSPTLGFVMFCLELQGHRRHAEMVRIDPGVEGKQMPKTTVVVERCFTGRPGAVTPRKLSESAQRRIDPVLDVLLDLEDPGVYLPSMVAAPIIANDDDPLGLDAILAEFTGGKPDDDDPLYYSAMQAAERLAAATARTRIHVAAAAVALAQVSRRWSSGAPLDNLQQIAVTVDQETDKNLRLLVEIARAAKRKSVPPKGLKAGLKRAVRGLRTVHDLARSSLSETIGGILPADPKICDSTPVSDDPLEQAWADGEPGSALPWVRAQPTTAESKATEHLLELASGHSPGDLGLPLVELSGSLKEPLLAEVLRVFAGPCLLLGEHYDAAILLSKQQMNEGVRRRNGLLLANATLLGVEAFHLSNRPAEAEALHLEGGRRAWAIGAPGGLSILARYAPPSEDL